MRILLVFLALVLLPLVSAQGKILIVVSSESQLELKDGKVYSTGYYFNELVVPAMHLAEKGYEFVIANPKGNKPPMDVRSNQVSYFANEEEYQKAKQFHKSFKGLEKAVSLKEIITKLDEFSGVFFPGGHAPMIDLARSPEVGQILRHFHTHKKPTALICHGPIALLGSVTDPANFVALLEANKIEKAKVQAQNWIYKDYKMTIFSRPEETFAEKKLLGGFVTYYPEDALRTAGGNVVVGKVWQSHVVRDRELITAQNPSSDKKFVQEFIQALNETAKTR